MHTIQINVCMTKCCAVFVTIFKLTYRSVFADAALKEKDFLNVVVHDVQLPPALSMKLNSVPTCNVTCSAHGSFSCRKPKNVYSMSSTDNAKRKFSHHCSLYDFDEI